MTLRARRRTDVSVGTGALLRYGGRSRELIMEKKSKPIKRRPCRVHSIGQHSFHNVLREAVHRLGFGQALSKTLDPEQYNQRFDVIGRAPGHIR
jgi:hypothetical protein